MIRAYKNVVWHEHLAEEDLPWLAQRIELDQWYPMESYERMGLSIMDNIAGGDLDLIQRWGRATVDLLHQSQPDIFAEGDPRETFVRFDVLRRTLFDYPAVESRYLRDGKVILEVDYGMSSRAEEAACHQSMGFLERLLEVSGAEEIRVELMERAWRGDDRTVLCVRWRPLW